MRGVVSHFMFFPLFFAATSGRCTYVRFQVDASPVLSLLSQGRCTLHLSGDADVLGGWKLSKSVPVEA